MATKSSCGSSHSPVDRPASCTPATAPGMALSAAMSSRLSCTPAALAHAPVGLAQSVVFHSATYAHPLSIVDPLTADISVSFSIPSVAPPSKDARMMTKPRGASATTRCSIATAAGHSPSCLMNDPIASSAENSRTPSAAASDTWVYKCWGASTAAPPPVKCSGQIGSSLSPTRKCRAGEPPMRTDRMRGPLQAPAANTTSAGQSAHLMAATFQK